MLSILKILWLDLLILNIGEGTYFKEFWHLLQNKLPKITKFFRDLYQTVAQFTKFTKSIFFVKSIQFIQILNVSQKQNGINYFKFFMALFVILQTNNKYYTNLAMGNSYFYLIIFKFLYRKFLHLINYLLSSQNFNYYNYSTRQNIKIMSSNIVLDNFFKINKKNQSQNERMEVEQPQTNKLTPWVQKYRPHKLDQLTYQEEVVSTLKNILKTGNLPHLLFYGPAGTGKTSAIIALAKELYGVGFYKQRILQLNASDQRGIGVVRQKVKKFASKIAAKNPDKNFHCPNYKIVILDEADLMTSQAQSALRRIIEDTSKDTRFCLICNYITKIIQPLASRCVKFKFKSIPADIQFGKLHEICQKQQIKIDQQSLQTLLQKGDLRQSINNLQSLSRLSTISPYTMPQNKEFYETLFLRIRTSSNIKQVIALWQEIINEGYALDDLLNGLLDEVLKYEDEKKKAIISEQLAKCEQSLLNGASQMPILDVLTSIYYVMSLEI